MRIKWAKRAAGISLAILGTVMLSIAIFAYQLHIDHNQAMGPARVAIALSGVFFLLVLSGFLLSARIKRVLSSSNSQYQVNRVLHILKSPFSWVIQPVREKPLENGGSTIWYAIAGAGIAIFISLWYITSGKLVKWNHGSDYFDLQANAFLAGQFSLLEKPPAALVALADPYILQNRTEVGPYLWDSSLYQGNYYLYWGPVPALMAVSVKLFHPAWVIEDQYLVLFSIAGLAIVLAAIFYWVQKRYFPKIPGWVLSGLILLGVLNTPVFWLINRPAVYEAAIAVGQFFLILGLFTALRSLESVGHKVVWMILTGFFWGAAIGSRIDLVIGIAWMCLLICIFLASRSDAWRKAFKEMLGLIIPLMVWGAGLAWFNFARFGNFLETGHRYQLTGGSMPADYRNVISASYILPNLYNILARPMEIHWSEFPFFFTPFIKNDMWPRLIFYPRNPNYFYNEPITGIFRSSPAIWIVLIIALIIPLRLFWKWLNYNALLGTSLRNQPGSTWLVWMAGGAFLANLGILSVFISSSMRYEADLMPLLTILVALSIGWSSDFLRSRTRLWKLLLGVAGVLIFISVTIGLLTNFQNGDWIFKTNNPQLFQSIAHFFTGK